LWGNRRISGAIIGMHKKFFVDEDLVMNLHLPTVAWAAMGVLSSLCI